MLSGSGQPVSGDSPWTDRLGRTPRDLRISVTDRCNFRCTYCMPRDKVGKGAFLQRAELTDFEEITRIASQFVKAGVQKIRITGGEPLLRRQLERLVAMLSPLGAELALTTNGVLLPDQAAGLKRAGLQRVTVSLDALDDQVFQTACDAPRYRVSDVLRGIDAAKSAGFENIKINCVVRRGVNEDQVVPLARHFAGAGHILRFIEFMDVGTRNDWDANQVVPSDEIRQLLTPLGGLERLSANYTGEVATRYGYGDGEGEIGLISSVSEPFCADCSRVRLSADGHIFNCLFAPRGTDILSPLRGGMSDTELSHLVQEIWARRADRYSEERQEQGEIENRASRRLPVLSPRVEMSYIGG